MLIIDYLSSKFGMVRWKDITLNWRKGYRSLRVLRLEIEEVQVKLLISLEIIVS